MEFSKAIQVSFKVVSGKLQGCAKKVLRVFQGNFRASWASLNPFSPGVLDPGNNPGGGPEDPQLYLGFLGLLYAP